MTMLLKDNSLCINIHFKLSDLLSDLGREIDTKIIATIPSNVIFQNKAQRIPLTKIMPNKVNKSIYYSKQYLFSPHRQRVPMKLCIYFTIIGWTVKHHIIRIKNRNNVK